MDNSYEINRFKRLRTNLYSILEDLKSSKSNLSEFNSSLLKDFTRNELAADDNYTKNNITDISNIINTISYSVIPSINYEIKKLEEEEKLSEQGE